jgi:hypothetical protein
MLVGAALAVWAVSRWAVAPLPLTLTLVGAGALLVILGVGIQRRARAAWAFAVSVLGVLAAAGAFAVPGIVRAGVPPVFVGLALAGVVGVLFLLVGGRDQL